MNEATPLASEQITQPDSYCARALHDGVCAGFRAVVDGPDGWPMAHCNRLEDAESIAAALSASPAPSGQGVSGEVAKCLTPGCKYRTEIKTSYAHSSYGPARLGITVFFPYWQSLKAGSAKEVSRIEAILHTHMERAVSEIGQYDLSLGGDVAKDWPVSATPAPSCAPGEVERALAAAKDFIMSHDNSTGCCMCGSPVDGHGYGDGHSPVDEGSYHAMQIVQQIDAALSSHKQESGR